MLPNAALKPAYDKVVWMYVYRDFSGKGDDAKADRVSLRMGVTSWPQLLLVDPASTRVIASTGRTPQSFLRAVEATARRVRPASSMAAADRIKQADARAEELETTGSLGLARRYFDDQDIVIRYRALQILAAKEPTFVAQQADALLKVPNDTFRYEVCAVLKKSGGENAAPALESLVRKPVNSKNPNVLRSRAVAALGTCGGPDSLEVIQPLTTGNYLNMLTKTSIDAVTGIAMRHPKTKPQVRQILIDAFPLPQQPTAVHQRYSTILAKSVHESLQRICNVKQPFPNPYNAKSRTKLISTWRTVRAPTK